MVEVEAGFVYVDVWVMVEVEAGCVYVDV